MDVLRGADLRGARLVECDLRGARLVGCEIDDLRIEAFAGDLGSVVIEGVEVSGYVAAELDRRHPERVMVREARTAADLRAARALVRSRWSQTVTAVPADLVDRGVDEEWSPAQTLRHLVFAVDVWVGRVLQDRPAPFHPLGLPTTDTGVATHRELGLDVDARPAWTDVVTAFQERQQHVDAAFGTVTDAELSAVRTVVPFPERGEVRCTVHRCLLVVLHEHVDHRRYLLRDLASLTGDPGRVVDAD